MNGIILDLLKRQKLWRYNNGTNNSCTHTFNVKKYNALLIHGKIIRNAN